MELAAFKIALSFLVVVGLIQLMNPVARRIGLVDRPGGHKAHDGHVPVTGGPAVAIGVLGPALLLLPVTPHLASLAIALGILLVVGVLDDIYDLSWRYRIVAQVAAALVLVYVGDVKVEQIGGVFGFEQTDLGSLSMPFTVLATVGLINALNMMDGIDGLAGSITLCAVVMLLSAAVYSGNVPLVSELLFTAGAMAGFLVFNLRLPGHARARAFLGNSGSAIIGLIIAWASFRLTQSPSHPVTPVLAPFLIAPPVIDAIALALRRIASRKSPVAADRTHVHHILMDGGFRVSDVVLIICTASLATGLLAALALRANVPEPAFVATYLAMLAIYFAVTRHPDRTARRIRALRQSLNDRLSGGKAIVAALDKESGGQPEKD
ncbi:MAG: MraY family glycosyltransferase [Caulobacter sp.]|nr:MraY family glycosyltransferase [Caulobacter sp.]